MGPKVVSRGGEYPPRPPSRARTSPRASSSPPSSPPDHESGRRPPAESKPERGAHLARQSTTSDNGSCVKPPGCA